MHVTTSDIKVQPPDQLPGNPSLGSERALPSTSTSKGTCNSACDESRTLRAAPSSMIMFVRCTADVHISARTCCGSAVPPASAARRQRAPPAEMAALETARGGRSAALMVSSAFSTSFFASCRTPCAV